MKILITGGNFATALKLTKAFTNHSILLADYGVVPDFGYGNIQLKTMGVLQNDSLVHHLLSFCLDHEIDLLLPLYPNEIEELHKSINLFNEFNIQLLIPNDQLSTYISTVKMPNQTDWFVHLNGKIVFASNKLLIANQVSQDIGVNGVFYLDEMNKPMLITV